tara:strand:- start:32 stop:190 length:159 start_codon:yes stop_codon:yes gene_type:complete
MDKIRNAQDAVNLIKSHPVYGNKSDKEILNAIIHVLKINHMKPFSKKNKGYQ